MRGDLSVIGPAASFPRYLVAAGTAISAGEPLHNVGATYTGGATDVNTSVLAAADTPVIGTHAFRGIANENAVLSGSTVAEQFLNTSNPVPNVGRIRGRAETVGSVDTLTELALLIGDFVLIDYNATGASDGGELYLIKEAASADTSGLELVGGNTAIQTLDVVVDFRAYRTDVTT